MRELLVRGKNTIDPEVIDPGGRSVEDSPVKSDFTFTFYCRHRITYTRLSSLSYISDFTTSILFLMERLGLSL
jgi:hypothetical protein